MSDELKVGDVVRLLSGGPLMTVDAANATAGISAVWFEKENSPGMSSTESPSWSGPFREVFQRDSLRKVPKGGA